MLSFSRSHLADHVVLRELAAVTTRDRASTAELLALIAEAERRRLYGEQGYPSLAAYLIEKLGMPEDMVYKRIGAARVALEYPAILAAVADGRLHLTAILKLRPHLTRENADELFAAAAGMTRDQVDLLIAERFPRADTPTTLEPLLSTAIHLTSAVAQNDVLTRSVAAEPHMNGVMSVTSSLAPERVNPETPVPPLSPRVPPLSPTVPPVPQRRVAPLSPGRYELRLTISQELHDKIKQAQELISHSVPSGDIAQILERALDELIAKQERLQFAATDKPRAARGSSDPHYVPASVRRAVRKRDRARCTYQSGDGVRCGARKFLQYDHVIPVARGGTSTVGNVRLRCRAHNQLEAERVFGAGFMEAKRAGRFHEIHRLDRH
jgi:5-methylcytosine-specific restriction endonuclease McrA